MIIYKEVAALKRHLLYLRKNGRSIGFVPTMGALHEGHLSLVRISRAHREVTLCSIFVNPTQFNDPSDFAKYPDTIAQDIRALEQEKTDILFLPSVEEIYPAGLLSNVQYPLGYLDTILEGSHRPGHFQGVCQVVHRLLEIVQPDEMVLGQKDFQQCMVLRRLVEITRMPVHIEIGETLREPSGLAMSSRNLRLSANQQQTASVIYKTLQQAKQELHHHTFGQVQDAARTRLLESGFTSVDYFAIADSGTLRLADPAEKWDGRRSLVALVAATIGGVRLIDNLILT